MHCDANPGTVRRRVLAALVLGVVCLPIATAILAPSPGIAREVAVEDDGPAVSFRVSPATLTIDHRDGGSREQLRIDNTGTRPVTVVVELAEFTVAPDGTTRFAGPDEVSAISWVTLSADRFEIPAGERYELDIDVEVPEDAEPGERYVSVILAVPPSEAGEGNISLTHRVAAKLYIDVPGERIDHIELGQFTGPRLMDGTGSFELTVRNHGNVHRRFVEDTQIVGSAGDASIPFPGFTVLGDSTRIVETVWADPPVFCWCTVEVAVDDGQGSLTTAATTVIVFPWRYSLVVLAMVAGLALMRAGRRRRRAARATPVREADADVRPRRRCRTAASASEPAGGHQPAPAPAAVPQQLQPAGTTTTQSSSTPGTVATDPDLDPGPGSEGSNVLFTARDPQPRRRRRR